MLSRVKLNGHSSQKIGVALKNLTLALSLLFAFTFAGAVSTAHADTITYAFTGQGALLGSNFTFVDTAGFLSFGPAKLTPTVATDLEFGGTDEGAITGIEFISSGEYEIIGTLNTIDNLVNPYQISAVTTGEVLGDGTLKITDTPSVATTPEPSSLILLGTGILGLVGAGRRRFSVS